jgi:FkbM family methyltransferase
MKDVGEFDKRNEEYTVKFSRSKIIKDSVISDIPTILDIGGHEGQSINYLIELFPSSKIYSFEPDPDSFKVLSKKQSDHIKVFNLAISDKVGHASFFKNKISHTNSLYRVNLESKDSIRATKERKTNKLKFSNEINKEIIVKTVTLDNFVCENDIDKIDLLKIDVQGSEENVLRGGIEVFNRVNSIIVEISFYDFYEKSSTFFDIENILIPAGFSLFSILDISRNPMNGRTDWVETLYRKNR